MSTEDELRNCRQGKRILKKRVDELERELRDARGRLSRRSLVIAEALRIVLGLRSKATSIDGWCSSCQQIDKHAEWCPWTRLVFLLSAPEKQS